MPEYYKTNKGYFYKKTKNGVSRISKDKYEKIMQKKGGVNDTEKKLHIGEFGKAENSNTGNNTNPRLKFINDKVEFIKGIPPDNIPDLVHEMFTEFIADEMTYDEHFEKLYKMKSKKKYLIKKTFTAKVSKNSKTPRLPPNVAGLITNQLNNNDDYEWDENWRETAIDIKAMYDKKKSKQNKNFTNILSPKYNPNSKIPSLPTDISQKIYKNLNNTGGLPDISYFKNEEALINKLNELALIKDGEDLHAFIMKWDRYPNKDKDKDFELWSHFTKFENSGHINEARDNYIIYKLNKNEKNKFNIGEYFIYPKYNENNEGIINFEFKIGRIGETNGKMVPIYNVSINEVGYPTKQFNAFKTSRQRGGNIKKRKVNKKKVNKKLQKLVIKNQ